MAMDKDLKTLGAFALGLVSLAIISVLGILVLNGFKNTGTAPANDTTINDSIDLFIAGIAVFGTFAGVMALVLVAKIMVKLIKNY